MPRTIFALSLFTITSLLAATCVAQKPMPALSADEADADFALQGEYTGEFKGDEDFPKMGIQVIALGGAKFRAVAYPGGLPGDGWNGEDKITAEAAAQDGVVVFKSEQGEGRLADGAFAITVDGKQVATLKKVTRKSPTLGKKAPEGAVVLFAGKDDVENWKGGKVDGEGHLMQGTTSKQTFGGPFSLHMEFMLSYMPTARGQGRSNSGVYVQGRHEVQVLDSFGLEGKHNECGGIYSVNDPAVNMCFPPLSWQTYDIDVTPAKFEGDKKVANARMTVRHNGVLVHDDIEVPKATTAAPVREGASPGPIYFQNHGNPVRFRNVWVLPKK